MIRSLSALALSVLLGTSALADISTQPTALSLGFSANPAQYCNATGPCIIVAGSTIDGSNIGQVTPALGSFTNLNATGTFISTGLATLTGGFTSSGGAAYPVLKRTAAITLTTSMHTLLIDATTAAISQPLPACVSALGGQFYVEKKTDASANVVTLNRIQTTDTIDGVAANTTLASQNESVMLQCDGAGGWWRWGPTLTQLGRAASSFSALQTFNGFINMPLTTPASSTATCTAGTIQADASFIYVCTAANTWKRASLTAF